MQESNRFLKLEYDRKIEKEEKKKDCLKKLHSSVLHQYLMVSSVDGKQKAEDLVDSCKSLFNQDSAVLSDQDLASQLENLGAQDVSFSHGNVHSLLSGYLLFNTPMCPSNLSIFYFFEKLEDGEEKGNRILLWVMGKESRTRSTDEIQKSMKQVVVTPRDYSKMKTQTIILMSVT